MVWTYPYLIIIIFLAVADAEKPLALGFAKPLAFYDGSPIHHRSVSWTGMVLHLPGTGAFTTTIE